MDKKEMADEAIDIYLSERMVKGKQMAITHFLARIYLRQQGWETADSMRRVRGLTKYYIDLTKVMLNPLKGPEIAWLASMINIAVYGGFLISLDDQRILGIALLSGTLVNAIYLVRNGINKWCDLNVKLAIYNEIVQIADRELESLASM